MHVRSFLFSVLIVAFACLSSGRVLADHGVFNPQTFTLDNGLQVIVLPNHRVPVVTHMVYYKVGSADEPPGKSGVAHLLEHLMFKGTKERPSGDFSRIVARNGGSENAFTSLDFTGYFQTVAADRLELMMGMEADRMVNLILDPKEVETERLVVLEERRMRTDNDPGSILGEHVNAALFLNYPYRQPVIGWEHEIKALTVDALRAFYQRWYYPGNAILLVAGDITAEQLKPMAERTYGRIPARPDVARDRPAEPPQSASRRVELKSVRVRQPSWQRTYLAPTRLTEIKGGAGVEHADALEILADVLGGGSSGPLYRALVIEQKLAISAGAGYRASGMGPGRFVFYAAPRPGVTIAKLEAAMEAELAGILKNGVADDDVERAKTRTLAEAVYALDSLATGARIFGSALASGRTIDDVENWPHRIEAVTTEAVNAAARAVIKDRPSVTSLLLSADKGGS